MIKKTGAPEKVTHKLIKKKTKDILDKKAKEKQDNYGWEEIKKT